METVNQILERKGHDVESIDASATVYEALERMAERDIGSLLVRDGGRSVGLFSERDYARNVVLRGKTARDTQVSEIMNSDVLIVQPEQSLMECMVLMTEKRVRHLLVLDETKVVGIVSIGDLIKAIVSDQQFTIDQLVRYISGEF